MKNALKEHGNPAVACLAGMLLLLTCIGLLPVDGLWVDLVSHFMLQYTVAALLLVPLALMLRASKIVYLLLAISFCLSSGPVIPYLPLGKAVASGGKMLKVLSANVLYVNKEPERLEAQIALEKPDIVITQETSPLFADMLSRLKKEYPYQSLYPEERGPRGLAVISRLPFDKIERIYFDNENVPAHYFRLRYGGRSITFLSIHPFTPTQDISRRDNEFRMIAERFRKTPQENLVLLGDFNASPFCHAYKTLVKDLDLKNAREGRGFMPTWPSFFMTPLFRIPIDHALTSKNVTVHDFRVLPPIGSDHLPFVVELKAGA